MKNNDSRPIEEQIVEVLISDYEDVSEEKAKKLVESNSEIIIEAKKFDTYPYYAAGQIAKKENLLVKLEPEFNEENE
jgi:hypothetical protein